MSRIGKQKISLPSGVTAGIEKNQIFVKGPKGELRQAIHPRVIVAINGNEVAVSVVDENNKQDRSLWGTFSSLVQNMVEGVTKGYLYKLKVSSGHFPISVSVKDKTFEIKNFFGERKPRTAKILAGVDVKIEGEIIKVSGIDLEKVSQTSANIEQATRITNRDKRVFMDRINIISKDEN